MMNHMLNQGEEGPFNNGDDQNNATVVPKIPDAISRLPAFIRLEVLSYVRAEATSSVAIPHFCIPATNLSLPLLEA